jgi:tRNA nucleotidyltransferase (CCA-adding enzyme)
VTNGDALSRLRQALPAPAAAALDIACRLAEEAGLPLFLVGGAVRDLLLDSRSVDLDIVGEGEVSDLARRLAAETSSRIVQHERFGTASVKGEGFEIDFARSRRETYKRPGALPDVEPAGLAEDLARRDFTMNAMALRLTTPAGELIDPFGGEADLKAGRVRILHDASFRDDATRMVRAARYAARLRFEIERQTHLALRRNLAFLDSVSGPRLRRELELLLREPAAVEAATICQEAGVLSRIHPLLALPSGAAGRWREALVGERFADPVLLGFCLLSRASSEEEVDALAGRLQPTRPQDAALRDLVRLRAAFAKLHPRPDDPVSTLEAAEGRSVAAVWALAVLEGGKVGEACEAYLKRWRRVRPLLRGDEVLALGVPPGPAVGEALKALRAARLRGETKSREDEVKLVKSRVSPGKVSEK